MSISLLNYQKISMSLIEKNTDHEIKKIIFRKKKPKIEIKK
jgi:hypothetical protein